MSATLIPAPAFTQRQAAKMAGIALVIMAVAAFVGEFFARQSLVIPTDAAKTVSNILANGLSARIGILSFVLIVVCDIVTTVGLYLFFLPIHRHLSMLAAGFRLLYAALFGAALMYLVEGFAWILNPAASTLPPSEQATQAMNHFAAFDHAWAFALVFFGVHVLLLAHLSRKSGTVPKIFAILLYIAGAVYIGDNLAKLLLTDYEAYKPIITPIAAIPAIFGELGLAIWLLVKGGKA